MIAVLLLEEGDVRDVELQCIRKVLLREAILYQNGCFFTPLGFTQSCCGFFDMIVKKCINVCRDKIPHDSATSDDHKLCTINKVDDDNDEALCICTNTVLFVWYEWLNHKNTTHLQRLIYKWQALFE